MHAQRHNGALGVQQQAKFALPLTISLLLLLLLHRIDHACMHGVTQWSARLIRWVCMPARMHACTCPSLTMLGLASGVLVDVRRLTNVSPLVVTMAARQHKNASQSQPQRRMSSSCTHSVQFNEALEHCSTARAARRPAAAGLTPVGDQLHLGQVGLRAGRAPATPELLSTHPASLRPRVLAQPTGSASSTTAPGLQTAVCNCKTPRLS